MAGQEPLDLVIILQIIEYMKSRANTGSSVNSADGTAIMNIVNNMSPGASFGVLIENDMNSNGEVIVGDKYEVTGQAGAVGRKAQAKNVNVYQFSLSPQVDMVALAHELEILRSAMRQQASSPDQDLAVAEVGQAMIAAEGGNEKGVWSHLKGAGNWALTVATSIGTSVASTAIKSAIGM
jgi:hypothetical protein